MDDQNIEYQVERRRRRRRGIIALLGALSLMTLGAGSISLAQFTDSADATWAFNTGSIDISTNPTVFAAVNAMMPGDVETQSLTVLNGGSGDLRYAMTTTATGALGAQLELQVREADAGGGCAAFAGAVVVGATALDGAAFGNPAPTAHAGDRNLLAGASEELCFRVTLPLSTDDTFQNTSSDATFSFLAEQTANN
jgi:hypothetical protein